MTVRIRPIKSAKKVIVVMTQEIHGHQRGVENALHVIGDLVGNRVKNLLNEGPKTGRVYRIRGKDHQASAPGEAPATLTGKLIKSFNYNVHGPFQMELGESAPYAGFLENGTRKMKPRPHVIRAVEETQGDAVRAFYDEVGKVINK